jgi:hypothetical protein
MLASSKIISRFIPQQIMNFIAFDDLTPFQLKSWYRSSPTYFSQRNLEALTAFLSRNLTARWSINGPDLSCFPEEQGGLYVVLLEGEASLFEIFLMCGEPLCAGKLNWR